METTVVPSRQETEVLFSLPFQPDGAAFLLAAGAPVVMPPQPAAIPPAPAISLGMLVAGYSAVNFFALSDQAMTLTIEEANDAEGPFAVVATFTSAAAGALQAIRQRFTPVGSFMRVTLTNTGGAETVLSFKGVGLPMT